MADRNVRCRIILIRYIKIGAIKMTLQQAANACEMPVGTFYAKAVKIEKRMKQVFIKECLSYTEFEFKTLQKSVLLQR